MSKGSASPSASESPTGVGGCCGVATGSVSRCPTRRRSSVSTGSMVTVSERGRRRGVVDGVVARPRRRRRGLGGRGPGDVQRPAAGEQHDGCRQRQRRSSRRACSCSDPSVPLRLVLWSHPPAHQQTGSESVCASRRAGRDRLVSSSHGADPGGVSLGSGSPRRSRSPCGRSRRGGSPPFSPDGSPRPHRRPPPRRRAARGPPRPPRPTGAKTSLHGSTWPGWIRVLPSKPRSRPWRHSASKPSRSRTSLWTPSRIATPDRRAASRASDREVSSGSRPGTWRAPSSLTRSLVPMTSTARRGEAEAISPTASTASGVSTIAHSRVRSGAPWRSMAATSERTSSALFTFGTTMPSGPACARRRQVVVVPRRCRCR